MQDQSFTLSSAGYIMEVAVVAPVNGTGTWGGPFLFPVLSGATFHTRGTGTFTLPGAGAPVSGQQGTMHATLTTGPAGTAQAVAFLALSPTVMLGFALDTTNRPYVVLQDENGVTVGESNPLLDAVPEGTPLTLNFAWNAKGSVDGINYAGLMANGSVADWSVAPAAEWDAFIPSAIHVGTSLGALGLSSFTGTIGNVQVSNQVIFLPSGGSTTDGEGEEEGPLASTMGGTSGLSAALTRTSTVNPVDASSSMGGISGVSAALTRTSTVNPVDASSTLGGIAAVSALLTRKLAPIAVTSSMVAASGLSALLTRTVAATDAASTMEGVSGISAEVRRKRASSSAVDGSSTVLASLLVTRSPLTGASTMDGSSTIFGSLLATRSPLAAASTLDGISTILGSLSVTRSPLAAVSTMDGSSAIFGSLSVARSPLVAASALDATSALSASLSTT